MKTVNWKVEGMTCSNCALTIHKYLEKEGMEDVKVSLASGDVSFEHQWRQTGAQPTDRQKALESLGYTVHDEEGDDRPFQKESSCPTTNSVSYSACFLRLRLCCICSTNGSISTGS